jgi:hypothetical protein
LTVGIEQIEEHKGEVRLVVGERLYGHFTGLCCAFAITGAGR